MLMRIYYSTLLLFYETIVNYNALSSYAQLIVKTVERF